MYVCVYEWVCVLCFVFCVYVCVYGTCGCVRRCVLSYVRVSTTELVITI